MNNQIKVFKITFKQQAVLLAQMLAALIVIPFGLIYFNVKWNTVAFKIAICVLLLIDTLPTLFVYFQYLIKNNHCILTLNTETRELIYEAPAQNLRYPFDDIASLDYYRSYGKGSGWHSFGEFRYYKIVFADKKEIFITCLMANDIENTLEKLLDLKAKRHFRLPCYI